MYAFLSGSGGWVIEEVEDPNGALNRAGEYCSIAMDQSDVPHIAYYYHHYSYPRGYCKYARRDPDGSWVVGYIHSHSSNSVYAGLYTSIAVTYDPVWEVTVPHVCYQYSGHLYHAYLDPETSTWNLEAIDEGGSVGEWTSMVMDSQDHIYISYYDAGGKDLRFAFHDGEQWGTFLADGEGIGEDVGMYTSIVLDQAGNPHITYYDEGEKDLLHLTISMGSLR